MIDFLHYQYDFFIEKGFVFYKVEDNLKKQFVKYLWLDSPLCDNKTLTPIDKSIYLKSHDLRFQEASLRPYVRECYLSFLQKNPQREKEIIKNCWQLTGILLGDMYLSFFDVFDKNKTISLVDKCVVSEFSLSFNPEIMQERFNAAGFSKEDNLNFWHRYLMPRKTSLNKPGSSLVYVSFLQKLFNTQEQKIFHPYFTRLASINQPIEFNFLEHSDIKTTTLLLNLNKMMKIFQISNWNTDKYANWLNFFIPALGEHLGAKYAEAKYVNKTKRLYRATFSGDITESHVKEMIGQYFIHLKENPSASEKDIKTWLYQKELDMTLPCKDSSSSHRVKI